VSGEPGLVARLALPGMAWADIADHGQDLPMSVDEAPYIARAGEKRRRDFVLGRSCARKALDRLGLAVDAIAMGPRGEPLWPEGFVGSITHTQGYAAAAAAPRSAFAAIGIDAERLDGVSADIGRKLFRPEELDALAGLDDTAWRRAAATMFSAKEAYYKACLAHAGALEWRRLCVTLGPDGFSVSQEDGRQAAGRFAVADGMVLTLVGISA
jgi:4'-phosphopantetheinyl transferase EntD